MLLQFHSEADFEEFFRQEEDSPRNYRFSGQVPVEFPVFLQSGRAGIIGEEVFRVVSKDVFQKKEYELAKEQAALLANRQQECRHASLSR